MTTPTVLAALVALSAVKPSLAFWRLECREISGMGRIDPMVSPSMPSDHSHIIFGGTNFGLNTTYDDLMASSGTSCSVVQDKSAYWTPSLYFQHANGSFELVRTVGGMLAYYLPLSQGDQKVQAFPAGFRMIAGDARQRNQTFDPALVDSDAATAKAASTQAGLSQAAIGFNCLHYNTGVNEPSGYRHHLPDKSFLDTTCTDGLRLEMYFPSCWNGQDVDSEDHKSHVVYSNPITGGFCPEGFNSRVPTLLYETIYNTYAFMKVPGQFVLSNGDPTGYGYHADFFSGWDPELLQNAIDTCKSPSGKQSDCPVFDLQSNDKAAKQTFPAVDVLKGEDVVGPMDSLPGNVPIQLGPAYATALRSNVVSQPKASATQVIIPSSKTDIPKETDVPTNETALTDNTGATVSIVAHDAKSLRTGGLPSAPSATIATLGVAHAVYNAPAVTSSVAQAQVAPTQTFMTTIWKTRAGGNVEEIFVKEVDVTVTMTEPAAIFTETATAHFHRHVQHRRHLRHAF